MVYVRLRDISARRIFGPTEVRTTVYINDLEQYTKGGTFSVYIGKYMLHGAVLELINYYFFRWLGSTSLLRTLTKEPDWNVLRSFQPYEIIDPQ